MKKNPFVWHVVEQFVIGLMSGSSLDGIDLAYCHIKEKSGQLACDILAADCIAYSEEWQSKLRLLPAVSARELWQAHAAIGKLLGETVVHFLQTHSIGKVDFVASHGHTVFHFPNEGFTTQIGDGAALATACKLPVVCDFRTTDVAHGGTGAPIVPIADLLLYKEYTFCLNLGGIANISAKSGSNIVAYDIAPCNQLLNFFAQQAGKEFDNEGYMARKGNISNVLLQQLQELEYHKMGAPKSLDNGFSKTQVLPLFTNMKVEDKLRTAVEYIANVLAMELQLAAEKVGANLHTAQVLATGGGAFNTFLMERIAALTPVKVIVPPTQVVKFKEAQAMALMGFLRWHGRANVLCAVTGANKNTINGAIYLG